jgi:hypothetical protein
MLTRFRSLLVLLVVLAPVYTGADRACVVTPRPDTLVAVSSIRVQGMLQDEARNTVDGRVQLRVNGVPLAAASTTSGGFMFDVPLSVGVNVIEGTTARQVSGTQVPGTFLALRVQRKTDLEPRGAQPYFLNFSDPAYQQQVRDFIRLTVDATLSAAQLNTLLQQVNERVRERFRDSYERNGLNIVLVSTPSTAGSGISQIFFNGTTANQDTPFGQAPLDYRNLNKQQTGTVFMAVLRRSFVDARQLLLATPARRTDTPEQRAIDLGNILSKVGIHELAHTFGLVASGPQLLDGCAAHNCPEAQFDAVNNALDPSLGVRVRGQDPDFVNRFDRGAFFMDVQRTAAADFGSASATMRIEQLPVFNSFNFGYLDILH